MKGLVISKEGKVLGILSLIVLVTFCIKKIYKYLLGRKNTVVNEYTLEDKAILIKLINHDKVLIRYNNSMYLLKLKNNLDYIEGYYLPITIRIREKNSGNITSAIEYIGDFEVVSSNVIIQ